MAPRRFIRRMFAIPRDLRGAVLLLSWTWLSVAPTYCAADGSRAAQRCLDAYRSAEHSERAAHLRAAKRAWSACANSSCSSTLRTACAAKVAQLDLDIPTIVPLVTDRAGTPRVDVAVRVDGKLLTSQLDGRALPVDPGLHAFTFAIDGRLITKTVLTAQGQRNHPIRVSLSDDERRPTAEPLPKKPSPEASLKSSRLAAVVPRAHGPNLVPYLLGGVALLGGGGYAWLVHWGGQDNARLARCSPNCSPASVQHIRDLYLAADISLGVAIASLGAATWLWLTSDDSSEPRRSEAAYSVQVRPLRAGAVATFARRF